MLSDSRLPQQFEAEALSTAVYLRNRCPTKVLPEMTPVTPSEAFTGVKPNDKHLRTFGCVAYSHVPKDEWHKLDSKAKKCIFLGYGREVKGYRLYGTQHKRVFHSRDVLFNETEFECKEPAL